MVHEKTDAPTDVLFNVGLAVFFSKENWVPCYGHFYMVSVFDKHKQDT
jgi:hypothetical protein